LRRCINKGKCIGKSEDQKNFSENLKQPFDIKINFIPFETYDNINTTNKKVRLPNSLKSYSGKTKISLVEEPDKPEKNNKQDRT